MRLIVAVGFVWAGLHFLIGTTLMPRGLDRPLSLAAAPNAAFAAVVLLAWLVASGFLGQLAAGPRYRERGLVIVCAALALWSAAGGTVDDWLILSQPNEAAPPSGAVYWPLVFEYVYLAIALAMVVAASSLAGVGDAAEATVAARLRGVFGLERAELAKGRGWLALLITIAVIGVLMMVLTGSPVGRTQPGQVYFAVAVACAAGVFIATRLSGVHEPIWYWPAPILAGLIGMLVAVINPGFLVPVEYNQLNSIPAWGLARALPMQMVGVGVAVSMWTLRATSGGSPHPRD